MGVETRVRYINGLPHPATVAVNRALDGIQPLLPGFEKVPRSPQTSEKTYLSSFAENANESGLDTHVKVLTLPVVIPASVSRGAQAEMRTLANARLLTVMRGNRNTDLARPIRPDVREILAKDCQHITSLIRLVEEGLWGTDLYIQALKLDNARASSTQSENDIRKPNVHFDAGPWSFHAYSEPTFQYFANVGTKPRQFRFIPVSSEAMIAQLEADGVILPGVGHDIAAQDILSLYQTHYLPPFETVIVEPGQLVIFNGRRFAHDAGKSRVGSLIKGRFTPSNEPDFAMMLDSSRYDHHVGRYDPTLSLLADPGSEKFWKEEAPNLKY